MDKAPAQKSPSISFEEGVDTVFKIYLMDESIRHLKFASGRKTRASDILAGILRVMKVEEKNNGLFALWMIGDALQLQLKSNHEPAVVREQWTQLMLKFAACEPTESPKLVLKRDAFVLKAMERKVRDEVALELLFDEARYNVIYSKYPCLIEDAVYLAGILLQLFVIESPNLTPKAIAEEKLSRLIPVELIGKQKASEWQEQILKSHSTQATKNSKTILYLLYLQYAWQWPFYGSTFFIGSYTPKATGIVLREQPSVLARIGVNAESLCIIHEDTNSLEFSWEFQDISWDSIVENGNNLFLIEYGPVDKPEQLIIISDMSQLIDSMVTRAVEEANKREEAILQARVNQGGPEELPIASIETGLSLEDRNRKPKFRSLKKIFL